jgi:predicted acylesterase/phospholipase RssA
VTDVGDSADEELNLALQGGGAHGAFTWGCSTLCRIRPSLRRLERGSAGAMNAVVLADGWAKDGRGRAPRWSRSGPGGHADAGSHGDRARADAVA